MPLRTKRDVLTSIKRRNRTANGSLYTTFEIYFGTDNNGNRLRATRPTEREARAHIEDYFANVKASGPAICELKPSEIYDAKSALEMLREKGMADITLTEAIRRYLEQEQSRSAINHKTLAEAFAGYMDSISDVQRVHKQAVADRVGRFIQIFGADKDCCAVTPQWIAKYLASFDEKLSQKTINNRMSYIKSFFFWCMKNERRYILENPMADMNQKRIAYKQPEYMTADNALKLFRAMERSKYANILLPVMVLSYFCGIRREEISRLSENSRDIMAEEGTIRISMPKGWTQGMAPRMIPMPANARAWAEKYNIRENIQKIGSIGTSFRRLVKLGESIGVKVPPNCGRHTFITMHVAAYGNPQVTEAMCGTSKKMRTTHYMGLSTKGEGDKYFGIYPDGMDAIAKG